MKITGKIIDIKDSQQVSASFRKRSFVVEHTDNLEHPEYITFELVQDKCELLNVFQKEQEVEVSFALKGRKWISPEGEIKYFNSFQAFGIKAIGKTINNFYQKNQDKLTATKAESFLSNDSDDLPF